MWCCHLQSAWWNTAHGLEDSKATPEKGVRSVSICLNTFESCLMMSSTVNVIIHIHVNHVINHEWCWHLQLAWWNTDQGLEASKATPEEVVWIHLNHGEMSSALSMVKLILQHLVMLLEE